MEITVGSKWVGKNNKGEIEIHGVYPNGLIEYSYTLNPDRFFSTNKKGILEYFSPKTDTKDDITVGSVWKSKESGNEFEVTGTEDGTGIPIDYFDIETGENYAASVYDFLKQYEFISVGSPMEFDNVNNPQHYTNGQVECIDAIRAALTTEEFRGFCKGNVLKYTWREKHKGGNESLEKAVWYLKQMVGE